MTDDGAGIDPEAVREAAVRRDLLDRQAAGALADVAVIDLIFRTGFSTRDGADAIAGRGVGLAVVREAVARLHGRVEVRTTPGRFTDCAAPTRRRTS